MSSVTHTTQAYLFVLTSTKTLSCAPQSTRLHLYIAVLCHGVYVMCQTPVGTEQCGGI